MAEQQDNIDEKVEFRKLPLLASPLIIVEDLGERSLNASISQDSGPLYDPERHHHLHPHSGVPIFKHYHESRPVELFYDLFFVANLGVFTGDLPLNTLHTIALYVGFFSVLWFTWFQIALYDVRFSHDSIFDRMCKACQFGVMIGFAISSTRFQPSIDYSASEALTLTLMSSRLILMAQYSSTLWAVRSYRCVRTPLNTQISFTGAAAMVYLGLFWKFHEHSESNAYIAWYLVAILESIVSIAICYRWPHVGLKGTHVGERMSLLTLIILGEGIFLLMEALASYVEASWSWVPSTISNIACCVLIIYFFYMLYFDRFRNHDFGTIFRRQLWCWLHFPFHVCLVLALKGARHFTVWSHSWRVAESRNYDITDAVNEYWNGTSEHPWAAAASAIKDIAEDGVWKYYNEEETHHSRKFVNEAVQMMINITDNTRAGNDTAWSIITRICTDLFEVDISSLGIKLPHSINESTNTASNHRDNVKTTHMMDELFQFIFTYFFITTGLTIVLCVLIGLVARPPKNRSDYLKNGVTAFLGLSISLLSLLGLAFQDNSKHNGIMNYASTPWVLPTIALVLLASVILR